MTTIHMCTSSKLDLSLFHQSYADSSEDGGEIQHETWNNSDQKKKLKYSTDFCITIQLLEYIDQYTKHIVHHSILYCKLIVRILICQQISMNNKQYSLRNQSINIYYVSTTTLCYLPVSSTSLSLVPFCFSFHLTKENMHLPLFFICKKSTMISY